MSAETAVVMAQQLGLHPSLGPQVVRVEMVEARANDWARQSREMVDGKIRFRVAARVVRAFGAQTMVYVVVASLTGSK